MVALDIEETGQPGKLGELYEVTKRGLFCPHLMATIQPISGDPTGKHGPSPHCSIGDEVHEWPNGALHRFMVEGMASRRQPLDVLISTAGEIRTYAEEEYENAKAVLADPSLDPEMYVIVYEADEGDDWRDPATWAKANPNYPVSPKHEFLESLCRQAQRNPRLENDFKRYHLGIWVEQAKRWFQMDRWRDNTAAPADPELWQKLVAQLAGRRAFGGTDLASTDDVTAHCWVFPPVEAGERTKLIWRFWCPAATIEERDQPRRPYRRWRDMGALIETPGNVTDYDFIEEQIEADAELFQIKRGNPDIHEIAIDRWNATQVAVHLGNDGFNVALFGQGFASMAAPSKEMERLFIDGALEHGNNPIARWMFGNAAYRKDPAGNIKPDKEKARDKIDGVVAAIMGLGLSMGCRGEPDLDQWLANPLAVEA
jgi:phage terminase large subunit-like protein